MDITRRQALKVAAASALGAWGCLALPACSSQGTESSTASSASSDAKPRDPFKEVRESEDYSHDDALSSRVFKLSKHGKNVVVLMIDRALPFLLPFMLNEKPELAEKLAGFTFYPNKTSFGVFTNVGTPPLYGGYDYTPRKINERTGEYLYQKQNEALRVMPALFSDNGFEVTVCDPTYASYTDNPDLSIYDDYPQVKAISTMENVWDSTGSQQIAGDVLTARGFHEAFMKSYTVIDSLRTMTEIADDDTNTFMMIDNHIAHDVALLQEPDYIPMENVDNTAYEAQMGNVRTDSDGNVFSLADEISATHYQCNMAALLKLGEWFDYLRRREVFDNTRIIIVSDHSRRFEQRTDLMLGGTGEEDKLLDVEWQQAMLMCKDFGADASKLRVDESFMTNADVPAIALKDLVENPINPFTGSAIDMSGKRGGVETYASLDWDTGYNNGTTFMRGGVWFSVHDDVRKRENWTILDDERAERYWG